MSDEQKIYYKRLRVREDGNLVSAWMGSVGAETLLRLETVYTPNKWTCPKVNKLFVFETLEYARHFTYGTEIWECEVIEPQKAEKFLKEIDSHWTGSFVNWLSAKLSRKKSPSINRKRDIPKGSIAVDAVMIIKKVS